MVFPYEEFDLSGVRTYPLKSRKSKARAEDFARPVAPGASVAALVDSLPESTSVYPGHMGLTSLGAERASNPFLAELAR